MSELVLWMITRLKWVYTFVVYTLHLPAWVGFAVSIVLIVLFVYELIDLFRYRDRGTRALLWLAVIVIVPLGTLIYLGYGMRDLHRHTPAPKPAPTPPNPNSAPPVAGAPVMTFQQQKRVATTVGTVVGGIAIAVGAVAVVFFVFIGIVMIQCARDPKCM